MFKFDDRYIILIITIPGFFLLSNLYSSLCFYPSLFTVGSYNSISASVYSLILSVILGSICWWIHHNKWIIDAFNTSNLLKSLQSNTVNNKTINLTEIKSRYYTDFGLALLSDSDDIKKQKGHLKGSVDNMFFTMDRAFGLEKPSAYRLLLDALSAITIATMLSFLFLICISVIFVLISNKNELTYNYPAILFGSTLMIIFSLLQFLVIPTLREYYHFTIFIVYLDNQYRNKINLFIHGKEVTEYKNNNCSKKTTSYEQPTNKNTSNTTNS